MLFRSFNYGSMGTSIGHEIMHNFNLVGKNFDANAVYNEMWLGEEWGRQYLERASCLRQHYNNSEILLYKDGKAIKTNLKNNASQTWEEDLVDNEGMKLSLRAYRTYMKKHGPEARFAHKEDFNSDQVFFIGWAFHHCTAYSMEGLEYDLKNDVHSINQLRVALVNYRNIWSVIITGYLH
ncbi:peptidase family M13 [Oesophagostomum dentatum]|uniref:Peptidase family M13 n=1 Tax=Oesophagostomum dentatum TaxID=61180 RepID=A0A0B1TK70_OESDE|nr:peptidase family M13 [Oesophagostomum dentatum]